MKFRDRARQDLAAARENIGVAPIVAAAVDVATVVVGGVMIGFASSIVLQAIGVVLAIVGLVSLIWRVMR